MKKHGSKYVFSFFMMIFFLAPVCNKNPKAHFVQSSLSKIVGKILNVNRRFIKWSLKKEFDDKPNRKYRVSSLGSVFVSFGGGNRRAELQNSQSRVQVVELSQRLRNKEMLLMWISQLLQLSSLSSMFQYLERQNLTCLY